MSVNDSSRIFHPSAAQPSSTAAPGPLPTSTTSAPPPPPPTTSTAVPPTLPPRTIACQSNLPPISTFSAPTAYPSTTAGAAALQTSPLSATHSRLTEGNTSRVSSQSERSGRSVVIQDGLYPISAFVLKQGVSFDLLSRTDPELDAFTALVFFFRALTRFLSPRPLPGSLPSL